MEGVSRVTFDAAVGTTAAERLIDSGQRARGAQIPRQTPIEHVSPQTPLDLLQIQSSPSERPPFAIQSSTESPAPRTS
jgi:hypothetical protein